MQVVDTMDERFGRKNAMNNRQFVLSNTLQESSFFNPKGFQKVKEFNEEVKKSYSKMMQIQKDDMDCLMRNSKSRLLPSTAGSRMFLGNTPHKKIAITIPTVHHSRLLLPTDKSASPKKFRRISRRFIFTKVLATFDEKREVKYDQGALPPLNPTYGLLGARGATNLRRPRSVAYRPITIESQLVRRLAFFPQLKQVGTHDATDNLTFYDEHFPLLMKSVVKIGYDGTTPVREGSFCDEKLERLKYLKIKKLTSDREVEEIADDVISYPSSGLLSDTFDPIEWVSIPNQYKSELDQINYDNLEDMTGRKSVSKTTDEWVYIPNEYRSKDDRMNDDDDILEDLNAHKSVSKVTSYTL